MDALHKDFSGDTKTDYHDKTDGSDEDEYEVRHYVSTMTTSLLPRRPANKLAIARVFVPSILSAACCYWISCSVLPIGYTMDWQTDNRRPLYD